MLNKSSYLITRYFNNYLRTLLFHKKSVAGENGRARIQVTKLQVTGDKQIDSKRKKTPTMKDREISRTKVDFLGIKINNTSAERFMARVIEHAKSGEKFFVTYLNAHCVNQYFEDEQYATIVDQADIVYADGMGVVYGAKYLGVHLTERVNAGDFFVDFCKSCAKYDLSLFFLGTKTRYLKRARKNIKKRVKGLKIVGYQNGFFKREQTNEIIDKINSLKPDILIIGMGVPYQEKWSHENLDKLDVGVVWCVGALFDYFGGGFLRAPEFMRRIGLEWLFRLILEPRRLWRRYVIGNFSFLRKILSARKGQR